MELKKIHRRIKYKEEAFVRNFILNNNRKRREALTKAEGNIFKLKNNAGYGKFGENKANRMKVKFVDTEEKFMEKVGKPNFNRAVALKDRFNMCVLEDRPVSIAQAILDKSKIIMTNFYYKVIKKLYGNKATLLYGDTHSAYLEIYTDDFFADTRDLVPEWFDTSVYDKNHPAVKDCGFPLGLNHKKAGLTADDCPNDFITEFWGTASKEYCYKTEKGKTEIKAKGIGKKTRKQVLSFQDYNNAIFNNQTEKEVERRQIESFG